MGWIVVIVIHRDDDPAEPTDFGHSIPLKSMNELELEHICCHDPSPLGPSHALLAARALDVP